MAFVANGKTFLLKKMQIFFSLFFRQLFHHFQIRMIVKFKYQLVAFRDWFNAVQCRARRCGRMSCGAVKKIFEISFIVNTFFIIFATDKKAKCHDYLRKNKKYHFSRLEAQNMVCHHHICGMGCFF
jgi:hypothetical protein